ncbi:alpha/beta-hydrolase [Myriangium duriaei CBS 260.36]|uniref:Alpha/beta-hydrolase n=1 Tax=Myriangium duriaei CBS 260.36 TaxID=1168546 RepID=A0A9P4J1D3_9PEZI|nr:alpha/beta-hydrolase [Myriangium duriaei CBS 260.36]
MTISAQLTILLFPGAFGSPDGFEKLLPHLNGFETFPVSYPSSNPSEPGTASCPNDIAVVRDNVFAPLIEQQHKDVVILAHSYGGVVGGAAAKGFDKVSRQARGQSGGIVGLIYVAGNITLENESLLEAVGGTYPPFIKLNQPSPGFAFLDPAMEILYNDCDPSRSDELNKYTLPHSSLAFESKPSAPAWADKGFDGRRAYIRTLDDACNPSFLQDIWLEKSKVKWDVVDFKTGHMPFVSQPEALAEQIKKFVEAFTGSGTQ